MNRGFFKLPENPDPKIEAAFRYASIVLVAAFVTVLLEVYLALRTGAWQLWGALSTVLLVLVATYISRRMIRTGKVERATQIMIYSALITIGATPFFIENISIGLGLAGVMLTMVLASRTLERPERYLIISFVVAAVAILLDQFLPAYRLAVPELQLFTPAIAGVVILSLGVIAIRGFRDYSLRTKMIIVILTIVMVSTGTVAILANRSLNNSLSGNVGSNLSTLANSKAIELRETLRREVNLLKALSLSQVIQNAAETASRGETLTQAEIQELDNDWRAGHDTDPLFLRVTHNSAAVQLRVFQKQFPEHVELFLTDPQGLLLAATNRTSDYYQGDEEWWQLAYRDRIYIGQPAYDESSQSMSMIVAMAIREEKSRNVLGILRTTVIFDSVIPSLSTGSFGKTGQIVLYQPSHQELTSEPKEDGAFSMVQKDTGFDVNALIAAIDSRAPYFNISRNQAPVLASQASVEFGGDVNEDALAISKLRWRVIVFQDVTEALQPVQSQTRNIVVLALIIFIVATVASLGLAQIISGPLIRLNAVAEQVAAGDLSVHARVETGDETGMLARTFNSMTAQLHDLIGTLERRVSERTKALATSAEISRYLSTILDERELIREVVEQLKTSFSYYHVHIYLQDETSGDLVMAGGSGEVGASLLASGHKIPRGRGLVGRAARSKTPVLVTNTLQDPDWLPNPLLPDTHSEVAVPIVTANKVLGVLDVQHHEVNGLTQEDVDLLQSVSTQMAIGMENARSYAEAQQRAEREARVTDIGQKIQSTATIESALQVAVRELGRSLGLNNIRAILDASSLDKGSRK